MSNTGQGSNHHEIRSTGVDVETIASQGLETQAGEPLIGFLQRVIHFAVRILAVLMTGVILWGIGDVVWMLYNQLMAPPFMLLNINDILATFGAFMAVLIAIEIFINITMYLRSDVIHVKLVMATLPTRAISPALPPAASSIWVTSMSSA